MNISENGTIINIKNIKMNHGTSEIIHQMRKCSDKSKSTSKLMHKHDSETEINQHNQNIYLG